MAVDEIIRWIKKLQPNTYAEIGVDKGETFLNVVNILKDSSTLYAFDYHEKIEVLINQLKIIIFMKNTE